MALIHCTSCGKQVSEEAASCPACGHPVKSRVRETVGGRLLKWLGGAVALLVVVGIAVAVFGDSNTSSTPHPALIENAVSPPKPPPAANFVVSEHSQRDDECTQVGDYCIRVHCTFYNNGNATGEKYIGAQLLDGQESIAIRRDTLTLMQGAERKVYFDFPEAELDGNHHYSSRCAAAETP